ncbi:hypothetical protein PUNSTDRAFT_107416 [Punctularia strigosozonata HHB-11173 SS5]|uniref:Uncharacterized protein n=1 Tax=Punctularia strigosozonata (strain HHB-11173) TaxID=741275 RepID=R7S4H5_PUNST|nr:uncharacterized protein PUNSTDRAFT_107416 [Punctularia strigosozonata HHB-11173 SS5]EIN05133.1 hypothetical protein PUNSTDRAFT_107416 [Punctularia strigosozonata HHB-11173 SS5]
MGSANSVYMANASEKKIWVLIALKPEWMLVDVFVDIALLVVAAGELKAIVHAGELPEELVTIGDLLKFMWVAVKLLWASIGAATRPADAVLSMLDAFKSVSSPIEYGDAPDINDESFLNYLNVDGWAGLFGAKTLNVMVMSDDGHQFAFYDTNNDHSWIATNHDAIVRSKYGSLWQEDPDAGYIRWPSPPPPPPPPPPPGSCRCGGHCPWSHGRFVCCCGGSDCYCV